MFFVDRINLCDHKGKGQEGKKCRTVICHCWPNEDAIFFQTANGNRTVKECFTLGVFAVHCSVS